MLTYAVQALNLLRFLLLMHTPRAIGAAAAADLRNNVLEPLRQRLHMRIDEIQAALQENGISGTHLPAYVSIRQHTSAYVSIRQHTSAYVSIRLYTSAYVSICESKMLAYAGVRWHMLTYDDV
jgi:hypothetical protein